LFVANLPFSVDDAQLLKAFADTKAKAAHVVCTRTGRSRGYGFVEFDSETDQLDALKIANGKEIAGEKSNRAISVTISNSPPPAPATAPATSSGAPTPASPPATTGAPATN
jgi:RNA recognition motif-containing protein